MGFLSSISGAIKSVGKIVGGVSGALGSAGQISGFFGGPTSIGGITGGQTGRELGQSAAGYYDAAFPGTNPWERLGAGNPMSSVVQAKAQRENVKSQLATSTSNVKEQTSSAVKVAKIQAAGAANVATIHAGPAGVSAAAATSTAESTRARLLIDAERMLTERGAKFRSPEIAALAARAAQTFTYGMKSTPEWEKHLADGWWKVYMAAGVASHTIREGADAVGKVLGARVRGVPSRGTAGQRFPRKTSAPGR